MSKATVPPRCDLCDDRKPIAYTYVTENEVDTSEEAERTGLFWAEDPEWAVCQQCHELIQMGSCERLIHYATKCQLKAMLVAGDPAKIRVMHELMKQEIRRIITLFWAQKTEQYYPEPGHHITP